jgi:undecaprenyl-diphosphatase
LKISQILEIDHEWSQKLRIDGSRNPLRAVAAFFAHSGDSWFWGIGLLLAFFFTEGNLRWVALRLLIFIILAAIVVLAIKFLVRRQRPQGDWGSLYRRTDPHSFPSGHAVRAFMLAVLIAGWGPLWLGLISIVWASTVTLARVALGLHYLSDVVFGLVLGVIFGASGLLLLA